MLSSLVLTLHSSCAGLRSVSDALHILEQNLLPAAIIKLGRPAVVTLYEIRRLASRCPSRESLLLVHFSIALKEEIIAL